MPIYFSVPLPGPFRYSKRIGRTHSRRVPGRRVHPMYDNHPILGWITGYLFAFVATIAFWPLGVAGFIALITVGIVRRVRTKRTAR